MEKDYYVAYFDGMCEPNNPGGNMGIGAFILNPQRERIFTFSDYIRPDELPQTSNNVAEYIGLLELLKFFLKHQLQHEKIICCGDSMLVINQMKGTWNANKGAYIPYFNEARGLKEKFRNISFEWIPREKNSIADNLSKAEAIKNGCEFRIQPNK